ncbi:MAG: tripartite motif-containing protein 71 [Solirubrobacteraceae bacterium]|nr:tripartite motif-containing protein 71 [Solirubrobacteraceae bacterium]
MASRPRIGRRPRAAAALAALAAIALPAAPAAADCPGVPGDCPYVASSQIGQRGGGVLRFPQTVALGPDGAIYVGDQSSNIVQVFNPDGSFQREVGVAGTRPGELGPVGAVAVAGDNTLLVADGRDRIDRFDAGGRLLNAFGTTGTSVGQFHFGAGGGNDAPAGGGLAIAGQTLFVSDSFNDRVQRMQLDGSNAAELIAPGQLNNPRGLAINGTRLIVADDHNHRLAVYDTGGRFLQTVGKGQGSGLGQFSFPFGVAVDPQGRVFVADDINHRVVRLGPKSQYVYKARWGSYGTGPGQLAYPRALAVDGSGQIYVANTGNDRIDVFNRTGQLLRSFGASGRSPGQFNAPLGVGADANGYRAVADSVNGRIEFLNPDGAVAAVWGSPAPGPTILPNPVAVVFDAVGNAYVLDQRRARIVVFDRTTGLPARTIGSQGSGPGQLLDPSALAIDAAGTISVADTGNERIARFSSAGAYLGSVTDVGRTRGIAVTPDGARTYVAGTNSRITVYDAADAVVTEFAGVGSKLGKLAAPGQIALDAAGNLWVADRGNSRVQQFGPSGERLLTFGTRGTGPGQFINPTGVNVNCNGTLTVTDTKNNRVQQFALAAPVAPPCLALGPIANPPVPKLPTLPTPLGPAVSVRVLRATSLLRSRVLPLRVGCDTVCTLKATATLTERAKPKRRKKAFSVSLRPVTTQLPAGETKVVRLTLSRTQVKQLRRALGKRRGLTLTLQLVATADAGDPTTISKRRPATG